MNKKISFQYIAGFIDGEGHISIVRRIKKGRNQIDYQPCVMVCNTDKNVLQLIKERIGGRWVECINISQYSGRPTLYRIIINKAEALNEVLPKIIPHLIIKKDNAKLVLGFIRSRLKARKSWRKTNNGVGSSPPYSKKENNIYSQIEKNMPLNLK